MNPRTELHAHAGPRSSCCGPATGGQRYQNSGRPQQEISRPEGVPCPYTRSGSRRGSGINPVACASVGRDASSPDFSSTCRRAEEARGEGRMKRVRYLLLSFGALLVALPSAIASDGSAGSPTQYTSSTWTSRDGLPSSFVMSVTQDRDGYLWIGTTAGLVRFDGYRFTRWRSDKFPSPNPVVYAVWHARDGSLWVALGGTSRIARDHNGELTVYTTRDGLPAGGVRVLLETADGAMLAGGPGGL